MLGPRPGKEGKDPGCATGIFPRFFLGCFGEIRIAFYKEM